MKVSRAISDLPDDAAEAQVRGGGVDGLGHPGRGAVTAAVVRRAQVGPALHDLAGDARGIAPVDALLAGVNRAAGAAAGGDVGGVAGVPVRRPLPDVADHVV